MDACFGAISFRLLTTIELDEHVVGGRNEIIVVGQIVGSQGHAAYEFGHEFGPVAVRKRFEFVEQPFRCLSHEIRFAFGALGVKPFADEPDA